MATKDTYASVNDNECSWSDIELTLAIPGAEALEGLDFTGVKWARKVDLGKRKGPSGGRVMARTSGEGTHEASCAMAKSSYHTLIEALAKVAPQRGNQRLISKVSFSLLVQHTPLGSDKVYTTVIKGCRLTSDASDMKEGPDAEVVEITLDTIEVANVLPDGTEVVLI